MQIPDVPPQLLAALVEAAAGQRLALVGGVGRDLLLHRHHQDPWRGLPDLDLVVEGRAADLVVLALFALLAVALHPGLVFGDAGLADFDLVGYFYPYWQQRVEALRVSDIFRAKVIDTTHESFVFELTGAPSKIDKFVDLMRPLGLVEVSRTGVLSISRGSEVF